MFRKVVENMREEKLLPQSIEKFEKFLSVHPVERLGTMEQTPQDHYLLIPICHSRCTIGKLVLLRRHPHLQVDLHLEEEQLCQGKVRWVHHLFMAQDMGKRIPFHQNRALYRPLEFQVP